MDIFLVLINLSDNAKTEYRDLCTHFYVRAYLPWGFCFGLTDSLSLLDEQLKGNMYALTVRSEISVAPSGVFTGLQAHACLLEWQAMWQVEHSPCCAVWAIAMEVPCVSEWNRGGEGNGCKKALKRRQRIVPGMWGELFHAENWVGEKDKGNTVGWDGSLECGGTESL